MQEKFLSSQFKPKDIILYGISAFASKGDTAASSFVHGLFDPITAVVSPKKMDKLGQTVRSAAIARGLYMMAG